MKINKSDLTLICVRWIFMLAGFILAFFVGKRLLAGDHEIVIRWSIMLAAAGVSFLPLTSIIFSKFHDGGWIFSKTIGIAVSGWLTWYLSSLYMTFTRNNCIIILTICAVINYIGLAAYKIISKKKSMVILDAAAGRKSENIVLSINVAGRKIFFTEAVEKKVFSAFTTELIFFAVFTLWCYLRGFRPEASYSTEKFMDYAFMLSMMRADSMPPVDMWFSGNSINYYYVGQYIAVYMTRITGTTVNYGYNLALMTIAAFSMTLSYSLIYNVTKNAGHSFAMKLKSSYASHAEPKPKDLSEKVKTSGFCVFCGLLSSCAVNITASMHYPIYKFINPFIKLITGKTNDYDYWFPDPTRYIGHNPSTSDKTIHEFPSYSYILGDLHAHVINIMFVLTLLGILYAFLLYRKWAVNKLEKAAAGDKISYIRELFHPAVIMTGFFIGLFNTTNYWDFPIYFVTAGAVILFSNAVICGFKKKALILTALHAVVILAVSQLACLPFTLSFDSMALGISFTESRTRLYQYAVLWALPISCVVVFIAASYQKLKTDKEIIFKKHMKKGRGKGKEQGKKQNVKTHMNPLFQFINKLNISDLYVITLGLCAVGLVLIPEIIYVVDIYPGHKRANTMFKLTYQAYIMFGLSMGYMIPKMVVFFKKKRYTVIGTLMLICLVWTMGYVKEACDDWYGDVTDMGRYKGLDAAAFLMKESMEDYEAVKWLNENIKGQPVVLEANGDSYSYFQRVSSFTGLPTILGWRTHEWLWRSGNGDDPYAYPEEAALREGVVTDIYTSIDKELVMSLLIEYDVEYIYIGGCEREKFEDINEELLRSFGYVIYGDYKQPDSTYIIKVDLQ